MLPGLSQPSDLQIKPPWRSEEHTSELQSLMRSSYAPTCVSPVCLTRALLDGLSVFSACVRRPFLASDLFVNSDYELSEAGFRVLAELARSTQVLFFTHHPHLAAIARSVVGEDLHSECSLA